jgi:hypothetical protein
MRIRIAAVYPGVPTMVDAVVVAGTCVQAEWVGVPPSTGDVVDVELDIDEILRWSEAIAIDGGQAPFRDGPLLRGTVVMQDQEILTVRIADGLVQVEVDDGSIVVPSGAAVAVVVEHLSVYPTGT